MSRARQKITAALAASQSLFNDFRTFANGQVASWDIDPTYPVLKAYYESLGLELQSDTAIWKTFLYVAVYSLSSAEILWSEFSDAPASILIERTYPTGTERRYFRGAKGAEKLQNHINSFLVKTRQAGGLANFVEQGVGLGGHEGWRGVSAFFESIYQNGSWAGYKWADLMKWVHGYPITAPDIGVGGNGRNAGPIPGLSRILNIPWNIAASDVILQNEFYAYCIENGVEFEGIDQLETVLCDFNSMMNGRYYLGHDIDLQMEGLEPWSKFWPIRQKTFPASFRGEDNDYFGVQEDLKRLYKETRVIYDPREIDYDQN